jgi:phosphoglycerate dehydrogenase-like enzyme
MKIIVLTTFADTLFPDSLRKELDDAGEVTTFPEAKPLSELKPLFSTEDDKIVAIDPRFGGWTVSGTTGAASKEVNELIDSSKNLRAVCLQTTSFSWIDIEHARQKGIPVTNVRGFSTTAVSEWATMMVLVLARRVPLIIKGSLKHDSVKPLGVELKGKTAGVIGMGRIGTAIATRLLGLEMTVQYWSKNSTNPLCRRVSLEDLMQTSDVILPTVATNEDTENLITDQMIKSMRSTAIFVSVVHPVYNHSLLLDLASKDKIYGYGFESVIPDFVTPEGNIWAGPELAWFTDGSQADNATRWVETIVNAAKGQFPNRVN